MSSLHPNLQDLTARVATLEAQNRRWRLVTSLLGMVGVSFLLLGAKPADRLEPPVVRARVVEAEDFLLKDDNGHVYAHLTLNPDKKHLNDHAFGHSSAAQLEFYDANGDVAAIVPATPGFIPVK